MTKIMHIIFTFSCVSNLRSFQAMYLKFADNVDILVQIVYAKFENHEKGKDKMYTGCTIMATKIFFLKMISLLCYRTMSTLQPSIVRDTGNNIFLGGCSVWRTASTSPRGAESSCDGTSS